jgi:hypothetical protein
MKIAREVSRALSDVRKEVAGAPRKGGGDAGYVEASKLRGPGKVLADL